MDLNTFIVTVFCMIDDWMKGQPRLRERGPQPTLHDSEVLTIEEVGAFLGLNTDKGLFIYFRQHYGDWFPALGKVHRTTFTRQAANLWMVKARLWQYVLGHIEFDPQVSLVDSFPVPACRFARAYRCRRLPGFAAFGKDEVAKQTFYGLRAHLRVCWPGVIVGFSLAPANIHELHVALDLAEGASGWLVGDRNYWSPRTAELLHAQGVHLVAPFSSAKRDRHPWPRWLAYMRYRLRPSPANWSGAIAPRECGRVICGICARVGCAEYSVIPLPFCCVSKRALPHRSALLTL